eukprot:g6429.t1
MGNNVSSLCVRSDTRQQDPADDADLKFNFENYSRNNAWVDSKRTWNDDGGQSSFILRNDEICSPPSSPSKLMFAKSYVESIPEYILACGDNILDECKDYENDEKIERKTKRNHLLETLGRNPVNRASDLAAQRLARNIKSRQRTLTLAPPLKLRPVVSPIENERKEKRKVRPPRAFMEGNKYIMNADL